MTTDRLYQDPDLSVRPFVFDAAVADVFPDMIRRSVPGYRLTLDAIGQLAARYLTAGTNGYDLGCSLGAATLAMRHGTRARNVHLIGVDNSAAMLERCRESITADPNPLVPVELILGDVCDVEIHNASMVVLNYTLQFVAPARRDPLLRAVAEGLNPGGILVLSEKIRIDQDSLSEAITGLHEDFKRRNAYSELEISRKRAALETVLVPDTLNALRQRLARAGFRSHGVWLQYYNFVSLLALR